MVVMAIIAILATAGLSAYTGYIKKARDAKRIAGINAINKIVLASMSSTGMPPQTTLEVYNAVTAANNGVVLMDPLASSNGTVTQSLCFGSSASVTGKECSYTYRVCDSGMGYAIGTRFESASNIPLYALDGMPDVPSWLTGVIYEIGSCKVTCSYDGSIPGCPNLGNWNNWPNENKQYWARMDRNIGIIHYYISLGSGMETISHEYRIISSV